MKQWQLASVLPDAIIKNNPKINRLLLQLLFNRGLTTEPSIKAFLANELDPAQVLKISDQSGSVLDDLFFYDPFLFKDMTVAIDLIISHIKAGHKILVYGDYDADGVTAAVILLETLRILHAEVDVYLPDRVSEGYGLNKAAINQAAANGFDLIITVDNGIRNFAEVNYAKELGLDIIITDHHVLPEDPKEIPDCLIINPADSRNNYPWPTLAGVGTAFKLITALMHKANLPLNQKKLILEKSLDLVAIGTIADLVSLLGENRLLVKKGLEVLNRSQRLGLNELIKAAKINGGKKLEAWNVGWQIGPRLNAASRVGHANSAFALLTTTDELEAKALAQELSQRNSSRQQITEEIISQVEAQIDQANIPPLIIGLAGEDQNWNEGVIGLVAGKICEKYYRPTLIITRIIEAAEFDQIDNKLVVKKTVFKGSGRSIEEFNLIEAIESKAEYLDKYGGHPMACGFSVNNETDLDKFRQAIVKEATDKLTGQELLPKIKIEAALKLSELNFALIEQLNALAPYGQNNPQPKFVSYNLRLDDIMTMGFDNQHIKLRVASGADNLWAIAFGAAEEYKDFKVGDQIDLVYYLDINEFNGRRDIQLKIVDIKLSDSKKGT
ncbi:MAG: single-stranded-DNA-specific exonuclease RecJ [Candidatus Falkowbacteria bacterium]|nr:single-stranded-DNA-specific exonuclease RecJ [Candidatus Falkowbacteria bacterium]